MCLQPARGESESGSVRADEQRVDGGVKLIVLACLCVCLMLIGFVLLVEREEHIDLHSGVRRPRSQRVLVRFQPPHRVVRVAEPVSFRVRIRRQPPLLVVTQLMHAQFRRHVLRQLTLRIDRELALPARRVRHTRQVTRPVIAERRPPPERVQHRSQPLLTAEVRETQRPGVPRHRHDPLQAARGVVVQLRVVRQPFDPAGRDFLQRAADARRALVVARGVPPVLTHCLPIRIPGFACHSDSPRPRSNVRLPSRFFRRYPVSNYRAEQYWDGSEWHCFPLVIHQLCAALSPC